MAIIRAITAAPIIMSSSGDYYPYRHRYRRHYRYYNDYDY